MIIWYVLWNNKDWNPIQAESTIFINLNGDLFKLSEYSNEKEVVPVFINEAAYAEKNIAMILTKKEVLDYDQTWEKELYELVKIWILPGLVIFPNLR